MSYVSLFIPYIHMQFYKEFACTYWPAHRMISQISHSKSEFGIREIMWWAAKILYSGYFSWPGWNHGAYGRCEYLQHNRNWWIYFGFHIHHNQALRDEVILICSVQFTFSNEAPCIYIFGLWWTMLAIKN